MQLAVHLRCTKRMKTDLQKLACLEEEQGVLESVVGKCYMQLVELIAALTMHSLPRDMQHHGMSLCI